MNKAEPVDSDLRTDLARSCELRVRVSPRALRLLTHIAEHQGATCEALVLRYLSAGMSADRERMLAEAGPSILEEVLQELAPSAAAEVQAEVKRRLRALAAS